MQKSSTVFFRIANKTDLHMELSHSPKKTHDHTRLSSLLNSLVTGRVGPSPQKLQVSATSATCPDILSLSSDDFLVIGVEVSQRLLTQDDSVEAVMIPAITMQSAALDVLGRIEVGAI